MSGSRRFFASLSFFPVALLPLIKALIPRAPRDAAGTRRDAQGLGTAAGTCEGWKTAWGELAVRGGPAFSRLVTPARTPAE